jgi:hypothetical protein
MKLAVNYTNNCLICLIITNPKQIKFLYEFVLIFCYVSKMFLTYYRTNIVARTSYTQT